MIVVLVNNSFFKEKDNMECDILLTYSAMGGRQNNATFSLKMRTS